MIIKQIMGLQWECNSPSAFQAVGLPVSLVFDGKKWWLTVMGKSKSFILRDDAITWFNCYYERREDAHN